MQQQSLVIYKTVIMGDRTKLDISTVIMIAIIFIGFGVMSTKRGYEIGIQKGLNKGIDITLDTVNAMLNKQLKSDTSVTILSLELRKKDTVHYFLSRKTLLPK